MLQHWSDKIHSLVHWESFLHEDGFGGNFGVGWPRVWTGVRLLHAIGGQNFVVRNHEGLGVEVCVGDGVHRVDLGLVLHPHVVVTGVGGQSFCNVWICLLNLLRLSLSWFCVGKGSWDDLAFVNGRGRGGETRVRVWWFYLNTTVLMFAQSCPLISYLRQILVGLWKQSKFTRPRSKSR